MLRRLNRYWRSLCANRGGTVRDSAEVAAQALAATARQARPDFAPACVEDGRALRALGQHKAALASFQQATGLAPDDAQTWAEQAAEHLALNEREDARDCYELALAHAPDCTAARLGLARMLRESDETTAALEHLQHALRIAPRDAALHFESALAHNRGGDVQGALAAYQRALELKPDYVAATTNLGLIYLSQLGEPHRAQYYFERAIAIDSACVAAQANLGLALDEQGRGAAAVAHYERLIAACPAENEYRWHRGLVLLGSGDYARGWQDYEMRNSRANGAAPRVFPFPTWQGGAVRKSAALLVYAEQGMGDEIMFASCVPDLLSRGINCVIECDRRLAAVYARSFPAACVHGAARDGDRSWLALYPEIEMQIASGSLPRLLRRDATDFLRDAGYLRADPGRVAAWRTRLAGKTSGHKVGIAWRGGTAKTHRDLRSIPLHELAPIFRLPRMTCINLQRGAGAELAEFASAHGAAVLSFDEILDDVDETAALLQALDGVITADNTVAHLAGALGRRTWVMLPHHADWRWRRTASTSCWYPSVLLCRQARTGDWAGVTAQVIAGMEISPSLPAGVFLRVDNVV